jgi:hypothetical protein
VTHHDIVLRHDGGWRISRHAIKAQRTPMSGNYAAVGASNREGPLQGHE